VLRELGVHPFRAEQLKNAFNRAEGTGHEQLYCTWREMDEGEKVSRDYLQLFIQLNEAMSDVMKGDRTDGHSVTERGWNPPPKSYTETL
jgi:CPA2 family monovalent cation:H+ antiporter-2/glutathione-regulated potassium-efflux system ancillary protein KefC